MKTRKPRLRAVASMVRMWSIKPTPSATSFARGHNLPPSERKSLYGSTISSAVSSGEYVASEVMNGSHLVSERIDRCWDARRSGRPGQAPGPLVQTADSTISLSLVRLNGIRAGGVRPGGLARSLHAPVPETDAVACGDGPGCGAARGRVA